MKRFFSFSLYKEGMRQLRILTVAAIAVCVILGSLGPLSALLFSSYLEEEYMSVSSVSMLSLAPASMLMLFFAPAMVHSKFKFLQSRRDSDFHHALPYRRECVYLSFMASVLTLTGGIIIVSVGVPTLLYACNPAMVVSLSSAAIFAGCLMLGCIMLSVFMGLAVHLSGTKQSTASVFFLLCTALRFLCAIIKLGVETVAPVYSFAGGGLSFFDFTFFYPFALFLGGSSQRPLFTNPWLILYTVAVTLAVFALSVYVCRIRKSETATRTAPSPLLQHIYRCVFCLPVALFVAAVLLSGDYAAALILGIVGIVVYYLYELITTRKLKSMLRATPYLGLLAVCMAIFYFSVGYAGDVILSKVPDADEIESVALYNANEYGTSYESLVTSDIAVSDPQACSLVARALRFSVNEAKNHPDRYGYYYESNDSVYDYIHVRIRLKNGRQLNRFLTVDAEDKLSLESCLAQSEAFKEAYFSLPAQSDILYLNVYDSLYNYPIHDQKQIFALYESFVEEYKALSFEQKEEIKRGLIGSDSPAILSFSIHGEYDHVTYGAEYPVNGYFPKTVQMYLSYLKDQDTANEGDNRLREYLSDLVQGDHETLKGKYESFVLSLYYTEEIYYSVVYAGGPNGDMAVLDTKELADAKEIANALLSVWEENSTFDPTKPYITFCVRVFGRTVGEEPARVINVPQSFIDTYCTVDQ